MKTGIELIAQERQEQIEKHGYTIQEDTDRYEDGELLEAAKKLLNADIIPPSGWCSDIWEYMVNKPETERVIISGAFLAAHLDLCNHKQPQ